MSCELRNRSSRGNVLSRALSCIRVTIALAAVAVIAAGCAAANNATSAQASSQSEQPYKTMYGITSEGTTTDLYTELFGPSQPAPAPAAATVASTQPAQPVASQPIAPAQQNTAAPSPARPGRSATANSTPQPAPQPAPVQVAQQPAPPAPPPEPDAPTAYGIPSGGHTTDLYTAIFGPRRSSSQ
jgi:hypothetical protein